MVRMDLRNRLSQAPTSSWRLARGLMDTQVNQLVSDGLHKTFGHEEHLPERNCGTGRCHLPPDAQSWALGLTYGVWPSRARQREGCSPQLSGRLTAQHLRAGGRPARRGARPERGLNGPAKPRRPDLQGAERPGHRLPATTSSTAGLALLFMTPPALLARPGCPARSHCVLLFDLCRCFALLQHRLRWLGGEDSNLRSPDPETSALSGSASSS
jgi:hypothetical protein